MESDIERLKSNFRDSASKIVNYVWQEFQNQSSRLDRHKDENVFQQLQSRYINELQQRLREEAENLIRNYTGNSAALRRDLTNQIAYIVSQLNLRIRSL